MQVVVTERALTQMEAVYAWWAENRSAEQAARWYNCFADAIQSLAENPERCAISSV
jgi:plasmid stabilization system protein ParE